MHERRFNREIARLRDPDRLARLEVQHVVDLALEGLRDIRAVLDIGTGSGVFAEEFAARGFAVTGIDVNPDMLPEAKRFVPAGIFREAAAERLPFENAAFDLAFMGLLLHETDDPLAALREAKRVSRMRVGVLEWPDEEQPVGPPREHRLSYEQIVSLADRTGFKEVQPFRLEVLTLYRFDCEAL